MSQLEVDKIIPQSGTTLTIGDSGDTVNFADGTSIGIDTNTLYIDSTNNRVGIGTTSPSAKLQITTASSGVTPNANADDLFIENNGAAGITIGSSTSEKGNIYFADSGNALDGYIQYAHDSRYLRFATATLERMRIDSSGNVFVGKTSSSDAPGIELLQNGTIDLQASNSLLAYFNRTGSDGTIVEFHRSGVVKGLISSRSGFIDIGNDDAGLRFEGSNNSINPRNPTTGDNSDNSLDLGKSASRFKDLYLGGGLYVGGTAAANKLDDYEEGTWTPTLETGTITSDAAGYYTKIGRLVYINFIAGGFSDTSSSNSVKIDNLPFTNSSFVGNNDNYGYVMSRYLNISDQSITSFITGGDSTMTFYINGNAGASDNWITVKHNQIGSGAYFRVGAVYLTDA
jgi:hypothetical protein